VDSVIAALEMGYRALDTAEAYRNERAVGAAVQTVIEKGIVTREEIFIATKLSDSSKHGGYEQTKALVRSQLELLETPYIDLYMLHSPFENKALQAESWRALEDLYSEGVLKSLGVSNFDSHELKALVESAQRVKPMVVQNKLDVYHVGKQLDNQGDTLVEYARSQNIIVVAYSSFSAYPFVLMPPNDPIVSYVASQHFDPHTNTPATPGQVLLKWSMQKGTALIPRSSSPDRLLENIKALDISPLSPSEMQLLDTLQFLVSSPVSKPIAV